MYDIYDIYWLIELLGMFNSVIFLYILSENCLFIFHFIIPNLFSRTTLNKPY